MDIERLLEQYKNDEIDVEMVKKQLLQLPYEDMEFAKLDHHRKLRTGYGEVVYCSGKVTEHLVAIMKRFIAQGTNVLGSRASEEQFQAVKAELPNTSYDPVSRIMICHADMVGDAPIGVEGIQENGINDVHKQKSSIGNICVCTGGTADIPVAEEAAQTAEFFGNHVTRVYDVGVAGIHRLLHNLDTIGEANCIIAVAGMEGALPGVIAGLVQVPVIGVPTSVGYGTGYQGASAVLTMLNSCSNGIATVNIDNGFGAAYIASQINHQTVEGRS